MKLKARMIGSATALIAFVALMLYRSALINSSECQVDPKCVKAELIGLLGWIAGLYLAIELVIAPESAILVILRNALPGGKLSPSWYRVSGVFGTGVMLVMIYVTLMQILGSTP